jgi:phosphatidylglycerol lysyltransferase
VTTMLQRPALAGAERQPQPLPGRAWRQLPRVPATMCFLAVVWGVGLGTGSITHGPSRWLYGHLGVGLPSLAHGYWWTLLSAGLLAPGLGGYLAVTVLSLLILAPAERRMGAARTFTTLLVSQAVGFLLAVALVKLAGIVHGTVIGALTGETAVGTLPGIFGVGFALSRTLIPLRGLRLRVVLTTAITISLLYIGHLEQVAVACGVLGGLGAAAMMYDHTRPWAALRASQHEVRVLGAMLVALPALGVLATVFISTNSPMPLSSLLSAAGPGPHDAAQSQIYAPGIRVLAAPALLLLLCAYGLRRGRRLAWWLAVVINLVVLGACLYPTVNREATLWPVMTLMVLLVIRRHFDQSSDQQALRRLTVILGAALVMSFAAFLLLGYLTERTGTRPVRDMPGQFLSYMLFSSRSPGIHLAGRLLYTWVFLLFWIVVLGALTAFFLHTCIHRDASQADRARDILMLGGSTISYTSTWRGNKYWISEDGRAAIAYRAIAGVAVTVGEPYGDPDALESAITGFARFCEHRGLQPCLYSVTARTNAITEGLGWKSVRIAEDTLVPLACLQFAGKKWQNVRAAMNKAAREGITAEWYSYPEAPPEIARQIRQISGRWVKDKGLPEMGFTLGGLNELNDPNIRCLLAVGADRTVYAVTSWMPVYEYGRPVGWTIDVMRRSTDPGTSRGVMEFLIATAARTFQEEGARFISLSGAPLARLDRGEQVHAVQRLLDMFADVMEPVYGFRALLQFKDKFHPDYQPLYLTYPDPAAIGSIATAIGRAYLPDLTSRQALRLLMKLRWSQSRQARRVG